MLVPLGKITAKPYVRRNDVGAIRQEGSPPAEQAARQDVSAKKTHQAERMRLKRLFNNKGSSQERVLLAPVAVVRHDNETRRERNMSQCTCKVGACSRVFKVLVPCNVHDDGRANVYLIEPVPAQ